jgi:hypothetical protein
MHWSPTLSRRDKATQKDLSPDEARRDSVLACLRFDKEIEVVEKKAESIGAGQLAHSFLPCSPLAARCKGLPRLLLIHPTFHTIL